MNRLTPRTMHELPIDERDAAEELLDMAVAWRKGDLPLGVVAAYGPLQVNGHGSPGFTRHKTFMYSGGDPRRDSLHALIETLDDLSGRVRTRQGNYS